MLRDRHKRKAFELALNYAFMGKLYDLAMHPEDDKPDADGHDPFLKHALTELGFDPGRQIDDELIVAAIPKLAARGVDYAECVAIVEEEMIEEEMDD
jgi:hypothetical protein